MDDTKVADDVSQQHLGHVVRGVLVRVVTHRAGDAGQPSPLGREYTVTTSPVLVSGVYSLFMGAWEAATDLSAFLRGEVPELAPEARDILRALGAGLTDEAAARRLGTSLRTYRRRVAELMAALEVGSRFQAGMRAGELGLGRVAS